ncbi:MAG: GAF domain-containing protein, partial [Bradyrhizobium sp.]
MLTASAPITPLGWTMFVELPVEEAYASLYAALQRLAIVLVAASLFAVLAGVFLARRMVGPIQALRAGAERMGSGNFAQHISIKTGDELEGLANQFNDMGARLQESYADLEDKVESRTSELSETLDQQTATAEVLSSISGSMTDTKPVFDAIVRNLLRLFGTRFAVVQTLHDGMIEMPAVQGDPGFEKLIERYPRPLADDTVGGQAMLLKQTIQFFPVLGNPAAPTATQQFARDFGFDSVIFTPMLLGDKVVGAIGAARHDPVGFDEKQIELITNFAKQAVIAIENARLLRELHARTDDLSEALQQQTTTADVLKVISRSAFDLKSVLTTLTESAKSLCGASLGIITLRDGEVMRLRAESGCTQAFVEFMDAHPIKPGRETITGRVFMDGTPVHVADVELDTEYNFGNAPAIGAYRAVLAVPLMRDGVVEGVLLLGRPMPGPFNQRQVDLVQTFADQAVIAIENVRLFEQVQERTRELSLSLEELGTAQDRLVQTEKL